MNCIAVAWDGLRAGILALHHFDCLGLGHAARNGEVERISARVRGMPCLRQPTRSERVLVRLRAKPTGRGQALTLGPSKRVEALIETHPTRAASDLPSA